jgi:hypothetical protein
MFGTDVLNMLEKEISLCKFLTIFDLIQSFDYVLLQRKISCHHFYIITNKVMKFSYSKVALTSLDHSSKPRLLGNFEIFSIETALDA